MSQVTVVPGLLLKEVVMRKLFVVLTLMVPLILAVNTVGSQAAPLPVYVSILPQKYFVERIGGQRVAVSVMVGPGKSPATYEPTPKQMESVAATHLYFSIGVPFEKIWLKRLRANAPHLHVIDLLQGMELLPMEVHGHAEQEGKAGAGAGHNGVKGRPDPHVWTSPLRVKIMAGHILDALVEELPGYKKELTDNYTVFLKELDCLTADIRRTLEPIGNRGFLVFHPSWGYFADTFNLKQFAIESEGKEPGARSLAKVIKMAKERHIRVIFVQKQFSRVAARMVADAIGGRVEAVDPLAENYPENLRHVANIFAEAMLP